MKKLLLHCPQLVTDDVINRLFTPMACAVTLLAKSVPGQMAHDQQWSDVHKSGCDSMILFKK